MIALVLAGTVSNAAQGQQVIVDLPCDALIRPTDPGADAPFDPNLHRLIELLETTLGKWKPVDAAVDPFAGSFLSQGRFLRLDLVLDGLVNPPGDARPGSFAPFAYGDHPVYGFVEIDMDLDRGTGGEVDAPEFRYLGNIARFGGLPDDSVFDGRLALDASAFDGNVATFPLVDRHGEEFHLSLLGDLFGSGDIIEIVGNGDLIFDADETWVIRAAWFHRAHAFEPFSFASGGGGPGEYAPMCDLRFAHDSLADQTHISLVFPLDNTGAAEMLGEMPEPNNSDPSDQASVREALADLRLSADFFFQFPSGDPQEVIIIDWYDKNPVDFLDPSDWRVTVLLGSSFTSPDPAGEFFVWTDAYPNAIRGDVNGENSVSSDDMQEAVQFISENDAADGMVDGAVDILAFATDFSVFDVNYDGRVDDDDLFLLVEPGDSDGDGDADLADFAAFLACYNGSGSPGNCARVDMNGDGDVDSCDFQSFQIQMSGPDLSSGS